MASSEETRIRQKQGLDSAGLVSAFIAGICAFPSFISDLPSDPFLASPESR
jgi:hypothetical protein